MYNYKFSEISANLAKLIIIYTITHVFQVVQMELMQILHPVVEYVLNVILLVNCAAIKLINVLNAILLSICIYLNVSLIVQHLGILKNLITI